jgi:hypothetical protein
MLDQINKILFPNKCEVIKFDTAYIYPIFKNGSSSLIRYAQQQGYKTIVNTQIKKAEIVEVILRDPLPRFLSGFNTFVYNTKRDNPHLDTDTIIYFAENYLFLNRHYAPQLSWLLNLNKYLNTDTKLRLRGMECLSQFTPLTVTPQEEQLVDDKVIDRLKNNVHNEMYLRLDTLLLDLVGQELTFKQILEYLEDRDTAAYSKLKCTVLD